MEEMLENGGVVLFAFGSEFKKNEKVKVYSREKAYTAAV